MMIRTLLKLVYIVLFATIGSLFFSSCFEKEKNVAGASLLEVALQQAGENRTELEKALLRYKTDPADSLKYKATCFLIETFFIYRGERLFWK